MCAFTARSLLERLVGARLVYAQPTMARVISFEYLSRQLVWHEVSELLLLLLPLADAMRLRRGTWARWMQRPFATLLAAMRSTWGAATAAAWGLRSRQTPVSAGESGRDEDGTRGRGGDGGSEWLSKAVPKGTRGPAGDGSKAEGGARPTGPCPVCGSHDIMQPFMALPCRCVDLNWRWDRR